MNTPYLPKIARLAPLSLAVLLAACGGGSSGSDNNGNNDGGGDNGGGKPEPTTASLSVSVSQLPAGASMTLQQLAGEEIIATESFDTTATRKLAHASSGSILRIASVQPAQPQRYLLQCQFADTGLGSVHEDGSLTLSALPATDNVIDIRCSQVQLVRDWKADGGRPTGFRQALVGYLSIDTDNATAQWLKDAQGHAVMFGSTGATGLQTAPVTDYFQGKAYFGATDEAHGRELWSSDGSPAQTRLAADFVAGPGSSDFRITNIWNDRIWVYTIASQAVESRNGTDFEAVTMKNDTGKTLAPFCSYTPSSCEIADNTFIYVSSKLYANKLNDNGSLDNSENATLLLTPKIDLGPDYKSLTFVKRVGATTYYGNYSSTGSKPGSLTFLGTTDGTQAGTPKGANTLLAPAYDLIPGYYGSTLATLKDELYFVKGTDVKTLKDKAPQQLYKTNGTPAGTIPLTTFGNGEQITLLTETPNAIYFLVNDQTRNLLHKVDSAGTVSVLPAETASPDIVLTGDSSAPAYLTRSSLHAAGDRVVFTGTDGHLYGSDGSKNGTQRLFPDVAGNHIVPAIGACAAAQCALSSVNTIGNKVLITVRTSTEDSNTTQGASINQQYWLTDGTAAGTQVLKDKESSEIFIQHIKLS
ncbi:hypothetical protein [Kerstersia gyiorum]|uniref:ELWxxDGT repeat protein n=1 Tax=Kerstersia gyiorum TaxID=206506 RepID=A0A171KWM4_9BURK|nr:hypothetical protein [Kerstersia gyiorum]KKO73291.1 hypothetical protein AAV32_03245 [Kerstersia gyiorum]